MAETDNQRNHYRDHYWNESLDMFFPIINTCILECPIDSDHTYCQSKSTADIIQVVTFEGTSGCSSK